MRFYAAPKDWKEKCDIYEIEFETGSGNVFADFSISPAEAADVAVKTRLILAIKDAISYRGLTQQQAASRCGTDQPTLSKVMRGRMESVTIDRLAAGLNALGRDVEIAIGRQRGQVGTAICVYRKRSNGRAGGPDTVPQDRIRCWTEHVQHHYLSTLTIKF